MLFRSQCKGINIDTSIGCAGVVLVRLDDVEVRSFALREAVLTVKLELSSHDRVLTPAVHVEGSLSKNECSGIRETRCSDGSGTILRAERILDGGLVPCRVSASRGNIDSTGHLEKTLRCHEALRAIDLGRSAEGVDGVGEGIDRVGVVERLGTENLEEGLGSIERRAIVDVGIRLDNPDKLLNGVVKVELDLVAGRADRFVTGKLDLLDQILVRVLGHLAALISVEENVVDIEGGSNERLLVSSGDSLRTGSECIESVDSPETLANRTNIEVNLDFVILYESLIPPLSGYLSAFIQLD